jgi:hypothetical protein
MRAAGAEARQLFQLLYAAKMTSGLAQQPKQRLATRLELSVGPPGVHFLDSKATV